MGETGETRETGEDFDVVFTASAGFIREELLRGADGVTVVDEGTRMVQ